MRVFGLSIMVNGALASDCPSQNPLFGNRTSRFSEPKYLGIKRLHGQPAMGFRYNYAGKQSNRQSTIDANMVF